MKNNPISSDVYKKHPVKRRTWLVIIAILLLITILPPLLDNSPRLVPDIFIYGLVWGLPFIIWLITLWSINRYGTVTVTDKTFQVGRHKVNIADIDSIALAAVPEEEAPAMERLVVSASNIDIPLLLEAESLGNPPVFGGAYGVPLATDSFIMTMKDKRLFTVPLPRGSRKEVLTRLLSGTTDS